MHLSANSLGLFLVADVSISHGKGSFVDFFSNRKKTTRNSQDHQEGGETFRRWATLGRFKACVSTAQSMSNEARNAGSACGTTFLAVLKIPTSSMNPESHFMLFVFFSETSNWNI